MITTLYPTYEFKNKVLQKKYDFKTDDIKLALLTNNGSGSNISDISTADLMKYYRYNTTVNPGDDTYNIQKFELSIASYTTGGISLVNKTLDDISSINAPAVKFDADDPVFYTIDLTGSTGIYGYVLYDTTYTLEQNGNSNNYGVIAIAKFDAPLTISDVSAGSNLTIQFSTDGIFQL